MATKTSKAGQPASWRREFEIPRGVTFLNHASFGPVPRRGRLTVENLLRRQGRFLGDPNADPDTFQMLKDSRVMFASISGADPKRVAFVPNASYGINAILCGLELKKGERVLVPANEHPAAAYGVLALAEKVGARAISIPCPNGSMDLEHLELEIKRGAAVLATSWVQYFNGFRNDLALLSRMCHANGCFLLVDVTQGAGAIPLNMKRDNVDAIACGAQKWLFGQTGAGFFAISPKAIRKVTPPYAGWLGYDWGYSWGDLQRWDRPAYRDGRFWEVGTYPFYSVRFAYTGLAMLRECGIPKIFGWIESLQDRLLAEISDTSYRPVVFPKKNRSAIISISGPDTPRVYKSLLTKRIYTSLREGNIRVSPHFYNTEADIKRLTKAITEFDRSRKRK